MLQNQQTCGVSHLCRYKLDHSLTELVPSPSHLDNGSFLEIYRFRILHKCRQSSNSDHPPDYSLEGCGNKIALTSPRATDNCRQFQEGCQILHVGSMKPLPEGKKRKRGLTEESQFAQSKDMDSEQKVVEFSGEKNEKWKPEPKPVANMCGKPLAKQLKDSFDSKEAPKEDYVHVRAKRGQSTNRHSVAERLRRERIDERMKFLQELVPGCNKINGKAVMLDEIINHVLSLQGQVKICHSQVGCGAVRGDPGMALFYSIRNEAQSSNPKLPTLHRVA